MPPTHGSTVSHPADGRHHRLGRWVATFLAVLMPLLAYLFRPDPSLEFPEAGLAHIWRASELPVEPETIEAARELTRNVMPFKVVSRIKALEATDLYPCSECHEEDEPPNLEVRDLEEEHADMVVAHGGRNVWCLTCHHARDRDQLTGLNGEAIGYNDVHLLCGQCHYQHEKDFLLGAHGKTVRRLPATETEPAMRVLNLCTECHNPHDPLLKMREGCCMPRPRAGLSLPRLEPRDHRPIWRRAEREAASPAPGGNP